MNIRHFLGTLPVLFLCCVDSPAQVAAEVDGYPMSNFALTVNASQDGGFFGKIMRNPGRIGEWTRGAWRSLSIREEGVSAAPDAGKRG